MLWESAHSVVWGFEQFDQYEGNEGGVDVNELLKQFLVEGDPSIEALVVVEVDQEEQQVIEVLFAGLGLLVEVPDYLLEQNL